MTGIGPEGCIEATAQNKMRCRLVLHIGGEEIYVIVVIAVIFFEIDYMTPTQDRYAPYVAKSEASNSPLGISRSISSFPKTV